MVCEIVVDCDVTNRCGSLHPPLDAIEARHCRKRLFKRNVGRLSGRNRRQRVFQIVPAAQLPTRVARLTAGTDHANIPFRGIREAPLPVRIAFARKSFYRRPTTRIDHCSKVLIGSIDNDSTLARYGAHELVKLPFNGIEVRINVGVIIFEIIKHQRVRAVVHKLCTLIEERCVVFVRLNNEIIRLTETR